MGPHRSFSAHHAPFPLSPPSPRPRRWSLVIGLTLITAPWVGLALVVPLAEGAVELHFRDDDFGVDRVR